jgi:hypothetical protein
VRKLAIAERAERKDDKRLMFRLLPSFFGPVCEIVEKARGPKS